MDGADKRKKNLHFRQLVSLLAQHLIVYNKLLKVGLFISQVVDMEVKLLKFEDWHKEAQRDPRMQNDYREAQGGSNTA